MPPIHTMPPPSISLLRALRATETIRTANPLPRHPTHPTKRQLHHLHRPSLLPNYHHRTLTTSPSPHSSPPPTTSRGPPSTESTQTDFKNMDVFTNAPAPTASIDACLSDGFHLDNGVKISGGSGLLLVAGEAFSWRPWEAEGRGRLVNLRGQWDVGEGGWGVLGLVWPKPGR